MASIYTFHMRILLLTILFIFPLYYFNQNNNQALEKQLSIDSIRSKMGAPDRVLALKTDLPVRKMAKESGALTKVTEKKHEIREKRLDLEQIVGVQLRDLEEGWNIELKAMLLRLEPAEGEEIFRNYVSEQSRYQNEMDSLINNKNEMASDEEIAQVEELVNQLDEGHHQRLFEILGAHYEAVRDHYEDFMDAAEFDQ